MDDIERSRMLEQFDNKKADKYPLDRERLNYIGKRGVRRIDGYEKASGAAKYTMDITLPGMLHGRFLTSPYAHAEIISLDSTRAEACPGVRAVLRYDDPELPDEVDVGGHEPAAVPPLPQIAHFQGEEVGVFIVADSEEIAENALRLVEVKWNIRPFVLEPEEASLPGAPLANPEESPDGNLLHQSTYIEKWGDIEAGFQQADKIIEFKFKQGLNTWIGPERPCGVFRWNGDRPELWVKQQRPHICKRAVSTWFGGIPMNKIEVHCLYQGASFGGWSQMPWNLGGQYCSAIVARRLNRPVKWSFSRREDFYGGQMDEGIYDFKVGAALDGTITAIQGHAVLTNQHLPVFGLVTHFFENSKIKNIYGKAETVKVNKGPNVPVRCEQESNATCFTLVCNHVAEALGLDPIKVAQVNDGAEQHDMAWLNAEKKTLGFEVRDSLQECLTKGKAAIDWDAKWHAPGTVRLPNGKMHGLGFTWTHEWDDSGGSGEIAMYVERNDGTVTILGCRGDVGTNGETAYCQVAADELGMRLEDINFRSQIDAGFFTMTPDTSTNLVINSFTTRNAARALKQNILRVATTARGVTQLTPGFPAAFPGLQPSDLDIKDSIIFEKAHPSNCMTIGELVGPSGAQGPLNSVVGEPVLAMKDGINYPVRHTPPIFEYAWQPQRGTFVVGSRLRLCRQAHFMEVEVDTETGEIDIVKLVTVNDVGKVVNWEGAEGQAYGGAYMGVGRGRTEEVVYDHKSGVMLNGNLLNYKIPTILDIGSLETILVETGMGYGPNGMIGIGEDVATVVPAMLAPAVHNAIGKWPDRFPITPDVVLKILRETGG
jgi:CO/xanthine dehydrogenase Mo-binding subunit